MNWRSWHDIPRLRPLLVIALGAMAGIAIAERVPQFPLPSWLPLPGAILILATTLWPPSRLIAALIVAPAFFLLHQQKLAETRYHPLHQWLLSHEQRVWVEAEGRVEKPLDRSLPGTEPGEALFRLTHLNAPERRLPPFQPALLALRTEATQPLPAGRYHLTGWLSLPRRPDNPGEFDQRRYALRLGLVGNLQAARFLTPPQPAHDLRSRLFDASEACRAWISAELSRHLEETSPERTIILAMMLGATDTATPEIELPFQLSGTLHIFAVSGLHVAIVGLVLWWFMKPLGLPRAVMITLLIPLLFGYAFITGLRPSAIRAALMAAFILIGVSCNRRADLFNSLGAAALMLLFYDTCNLFSPGFQLSFGVIAAIALFNMPLSRPFQPWIAPDPFLPLPLLSLVQQGLWRFRQWLLGLFTVSASAMLGSLPLMAFHFHLATPVGLFANLLLVPASFLILLTCMLQMLAALAPVAFLQVFLAKTNAFFARSALVLAEGFAAIPGGHLYLPAPETFPRPPTQLTVLRLPAGGAANHLLLGSRHWLLDVGSARQYPFSLEPFLHHYGVNRLHGVILSHPDSEHTSAVAALQKSYPPFSVFGPPAISNALLTAPPLLSGHSLPLAGSPAASAEILHPGPRPPTRRADDASLILRLSVGNRHLLWCNDTGFIAEKTLLETLPEEALRSDILIRNQHNADASLLPEFLDAVRPRILITSNAGFPPEQKLRDSLREACRQRQILLLDQAQTGAVTLNFWPGHLEIVSFRGPSPVILK